jgi:retron-type reverse transcriptase
LPAAERYRVERIFSRENLVQAMRRVIRNGGQAAGVDRVFPAEMTPSEIGHIAGAVSYAIQENTYRPQPTKPCDIPKPGSREMRRLQIGTVADRAVAHALHLAMSPLVEPWYLDASYGFRPGRNVWSLLAQLKVGCAAEETWVVTTADVRRAFDNVLIENVLSDHRTFFAQHAELVEEPERLLGMVGTVLQGHDSQRRIGIDQGCPYSPTALNIHLHLNHDVPLIRDVHKPFWVREARGVYRYADNLTYRTRSVTAGEHLLDRARHHLEAVGLELKDDGGVYNLAAGQTMPLLGFVLRQAGEEVTFEPDHESLVRLRQQLVRCHEHAEPIAQARLALIGWVTSMGPAFERGRDLLSDIGTLAADLGLRDACPLADLEVSWERSWVRWASAVAAARCQWAQDEGSGGGLIIQRAPPR